MTAPCKMWPVSCMTRDTKVLTSDGRASSSSCVRSMHSHPRHSGNERFGDADVPCCDDDCGCKAAVWWSCSTTQAGIHTEIVVSPRAALAADGFITARSPWIVLSAWQISDEPRTRRSSLYWCMPKSLRVCDLFLAGGGRPGICSAIFTRAATRYGCIAHLESHMSSSGLYLAKALCQQQA